MKFISNKGKMKQVKSPSGIIINVPEGASSRPDDSALDKLVNSSPEMSYISEEEFYKKQNITTTKEKIEIAKKEKPSLAPPKKSKKKNTFEKPEENPEEPQDE